MQQTVNAPLAAQPAAFDYPLYWRAPEGVYKRISSPWGTYYTKVQDPKGKPKPLELSEFTLHPSHPKFPQHLLAAIVGFFRYYLEPGQETGFNEPTTEVQVCLLRNENNLDEWKVVVPTQVVGSVTVDAVLATSCDLITGESYKVFPPLGWLHAGLNIGSV